MVVTPSARRDAPVSGTPSRRVAAPVQPARPRLVDLAADWLSTVLALSQVSELPDPGALRARALDLRSRFERDAAELGFTAEDVDDAVFAMVAFLDATILNCRGAARDTWLQHPLQLELYGHMLAGEQFFERLDRLRHARETRVEALEVYACCLAFGYAGRYQLSPEKLPALIADVLRDVAAVRGAEVPELSPNAGRRHERVAEDASAGRPWWFFPALFGPAVILSWVIVWALARIGAGNAAAAIQRLGHR
jgi:type VI secretion system protein ImpK